MIKKINKKAAIGATMTWIVATVIIFVVITGFVLVTTIFVNKNPFKNVELHGYYSTSLLYKQDLIAILKTDFNGKNVKDYALSSEYDSLKNNLNIWTENKLPGYIHVGYVSAVGGFGGGGANVLMNPHLYFSVYDGKTQELFNGRISLHIEDEAHVYLDENKIFKLNTDESVTYG